MCYNHLLSFSRFEFIYMSRWFSKILDLVPIFLKLHRWSLWFALCNTFSPQPTNLKVSGGTS
ncbi:hypothetical protein Hanom_Chr13g01191561 [Helianthus anomalus]